MTTQIATGTWEARGDTDWFKVHLEAGQSYSIDIDGDGDGYLIAGPGLTGEQPYLDGLDPFLRATTQHFTATESGDYYFAAIGRLTGNYSTEVTVIE